MRMEFSSNILCIPTYDTFSQGLASSKQEKKPLSRVLGEMIKSINAMSSSDYYLKVTECNGIHRDEGVRLNGFLKNGYIAGTARFVRGGYLIMEHFMLSLPTAVAGNHVEVQMKAPLVLT